MAQGRAQFVHRVAYYVRRRVPVMFCLPAFPCKSTNPDKTVSSMPDGAEFEALATLQRFCDRVRAVYSPGCIIDIVSDGHVFSDCIGTDDDLVTKYTEALKRMMESQLQSQQDSERATITPASRHIRFHSLSSILDCFHIPRRMMKGAKDVFHPLQTRIDELDDRCRSLLLTFCGSSTKDLQFVIKTQPDHSLTSLYRGFSRFMYEDLRGLLGKQNMTARQRSRVAGSVALEMIQRNQAYSHLVEVTMPRHVRLSIHAHNNAGPKFAVCLLPPDKFQTAMSSQDFEQASRGGALSAEPTALQARKHLHIPTPWHGALVEVEGSSTVYVCKAGIIREEVQRKDSPWHGSSGYDGAHLRGGRFMLRYKV